MAKLLVQSQGSPRDPSYAEQMISLNGEQVSFIEYLHRNGIETLEEDLINSCHGNTELTLSLARDIQRLVDTNGNQVVAIQQGGLYFAKPSLEAANMPTVPVISIPLNGSFGGLDAFLAPQVPSGTAAIGGVGVDNYQAAAKVAKEILTNEFEGVYVHNASKRLTDKLEALGVPILGEATSSLESGLVVGSVDLNFSLMKSFDSMGSMGIFTPTKVTFKSPEFAHTLMKYCDDLQQSVYVRGDDNVAFFAAKVMSAYNDNLAENLVKIAQKKSDSYAVRTIDIHDFTIGEK